MDYLKANEQQLWSESDSFTQNRYKQFAEKIKFSERILDVGCNTGRGGQILKTIFPNAELYGIDIVADRLNKIPEHIYEKTFAASITDLQLPDNFFDAIVAGEVIEHIPPNEVDEALEKCFRLLKPNGVLLLTTPNPNALLVKLGRDKVFNDPSHVSIMSPKVLAKKQEAAGFKKVVIKGSGKAINYISESFPLINLFGSYLSIATKL